MSQKKVTSDQKDIMIGFLKAKPEMYMGKFTPQFTKAYCKELWEELTLLLNSVPNGASKDWCGWRKTWIDVKKYSKSKLAAVKKHQCGTGGGPPVKPPGDFDEKIFEMITPVAASGNENVPEPNIEEDHEMQDTELEDICLLDNETETTIQEATTSNHQTPSGSSWLRKAKPVIRVNKTMRLTDSIKNNKEFLQLNSEGLNDTKNYRVEKLRYLKEKLEIKEQYNKEKIAQFKKQTELVEMIATSIKKISDIIEELL